MGYPIFYRERPEKIRWTRGEAVRSWFKVHATCPPSLTVIVSGGFLYETPAGSTGKARWYGNNTANLGPGGINGGAPAFTNANYYRGLVLLFSGSPWAGDTTPAGFRYIYAAGSWVDEFATAEDAEADVVDHVMYTKTPAASYLPLAVIITRNNGTIGTKGQILQIDAINRGNSYLWKDVRPRYSTNATIT